MRLELEYLQYAAAGHANPSNLACRSIVLHSKERPHSIRRGIGYTDERTAENIPVESHRLIEIRDGYPGMTEGAGFHKS
jgi:hypothetical protein